MEQGPQKLNADRRLAVWTQRIADCHSSGKGVKHWCQENDISEKTYYWQRRIFKLARQYRWLMEGLRLEQPKTDRKVEGLGFG